MKLRFTPQAKENLEDIAAYVRERNPEAALRVRAAIIQSLSMLVRFPYIGRRQRTLGVRKLVTRRYPYLVYYLVDDRRQEIAILAIKHPAQERLHADT